MGVLDLAELRAAWEGTLPAIFDGAAVDVGLSDAGAPASAVAADPLDP